MGWTQVPDRAAGEVFTAGMWNTYIRDNFNSGVTVVLADEVLTGLASSIDLVDINQDFRHLELHTALRSNSGSGVNGGTIRFNGDAGANYDVQTLDGNGTGVGAVQLFAQDGAIGNVLVPGAGSATLFGTAVCWVPDYTDTAMDKVVFSQAAEKHGTASGNMFTRQGVGYWRSAAAINQISIVAQAGQFVAGSRITLVAYP